MIRHLTMTVAIAALSISLGTGVHAGPNGPGHVHNCKSTPVNQAAGIVGQAKSPENKLVRRNQRKTSNVHEKIASTEKARKAHKVTIKQGLKAGGDKSHSPSNVERIKAKHAAKARSKEPISNRDHGLANKEIREANKKLRTRNKRLWQRNKRLRRINNRLRKLQN